MPDENIRNLVDVDQYVGNRIKEFRETRRISQAELAVMVGVSYQQIQKYELGANRVSASRLWRITNALGCSVTDVFDGIDGSEPAPTARETSTAMALSRLPDDIRWHIVRLIDLLAPN